MSNKHLENVKVVIKFKKQIFFAPFYVFTFHIQQIKRATREDCSLGIRIKRGKS